jgi:hypothetical protein
MTKRIEDVEMEADLSISLENVCYVIAKAREMDEAADFIMPLSEESGEDERSLHPDEALPDPAGRELTEFISALPEDAQVDLVALDWLGRGDHAAETWGEIRDEAMGRRNRRTAEYLLRDPLLPDNLEAALGLLGRSCEGYDVV